MARKPNIFIFDMDGTLADVSYRDPYDASTCGLDPVKAIVATMARIIDASGFGNVVTSGRKEQDRRQTEAWLTFNHIPYLQLFMREDWDSRPDVVVKEEILDRLILPRFNVVGAFDDRTAVVEMWRRRGIATFQVDNRV